MQCAESLRTQAYFDGEMDAVSAVEVERHAEHCPECRRLLDDLGATRTAIREQVAMLAPALDLRARIMQSLDHETDTQGATSVASARAVTRPRPFWVGARSGFAGGLMAAALVFFEVSTPVTESLLDEVVEAHVRSLLPGHLIDVVSTDQHTVKPWFAGHTDVSPLVADFAAQGFRLTGGRADYVNHRSTAVVVYQHGAHVINVFGWTARQGALPKDATRNGYHLMFWRAGNLVYCAVSDTAWDELRELARLLQDRDRQDAARE